MKNKIIVIFSVLLIAISWKVSFGFDWQGYKNIYISEDGRVIDYYQNEISHSEGQGYGLLLALYNNDKVYFDLIWRWTKNNLQLRKGDHLFCWSWGKRANGRWEVIDYNNATDGDILIAWALYLGSKKWGIEYKEDAQKIIESIQNNLNCNVSNQNIILPGYYGFIKGKEIILNPSYMILAAYRDFAQIGNATYWYDVYESQISILKHCQFGSWLLPADWISLKDDGKTITLYSKKHNFSFDAYRVFLYATWTNEPIFKKSFDKLANFFLLNGFLPQIIDVHSQCISLKDSSAGIYAIMGNYARWSGNNSLADMFFNIADKKIEYESKNYYSATLYLLARYGYGRK